jgi:hypothetical protein
MMEDVTDSHAGVTAGTASGAGTRTDLDDDPGIDLGADPDVVSNPRSGGGSGGPDDEHGPNRRWWRRVDPSVVLVCGVVALGFALVVHGLLSGVTGDERANLPTLIEDVQPVPEAVQTLSQSNVFVDLATDYTGVLVIDGVEIETVNVDAIGSIQVQPGQQVDLPPVTIYEPGNATLTFTPSAGAPIEEFTEGQHQVTVRYWRVDQGPQRARSYTWTFTVV